MSYPDDDRPDKHQCPKCLGTTKRMVPNPKSEVGGWIEDDLGTCRACCSEPLYFRVLGDIVDMTNHDAPGIYDAHNIALINAKARNVLGMPITLSYNWPHNKPNKPNKPGDARSKNREKFLDNWCVLSPKLAEQMIDKLSGDLNYDNVAAVKQILKQIVK